jgi:hypothetical protein
MTTTIMRLLPLTFVLGLVALLLGCTDAGDPVVPEPPYFQWRTVTVLNSEYLDNRFFRVDLPESWNGFDHADLGYDHPDLPGRAPSDQVIVRASIRVYRLLGDVVPQPQDLQHVAAIVDTTGLWSDEHIAELSAHPELWIHGTVWRPVSVNNRVTVDGRLVAIDLGQELDDRDVLAVTYDVRDRQTDDLLYEVGDQPEDGDDPGLMIEGHHHYRMKLLKPESRDHFTYQYVLRNIYPLDIAWGDLVDQGFSLRLEAMRGADPLRHDDTGFTYLEVFGLDLEDERGLPGSDGRTDWHRPLLVDFSAGLLTFPIDVPFPFASPEDVYRANAAAAHGGDLGSWRWEDTYLQHSITPEIYDWQTRPADYDLFARFRFVLRYRQWTGDNLLPPSEITLSRPDWYPASLPLQSGHVAAGRADANRWFQPRERVVRRLLDPELSGPARNETEPCLEIFLRDDGNVPGTWGGIMTGFTAPGRPLDEVTELEIWINDFRPDPSERAGTLHVDLGAIDEDFAWPDSAGVVRYGTFQHEDLNHDGIFNRSTEDVGLDAVVAHGEVVIPGEVYDPEDGVDGDPYPRINNTRGNLEEDSEDLDGNDRFDRGDHYLAFAIDLRQDTADLDVPLVHPDEDLRGTAWRRYVLPLAEGEVRSDGPFGPVDELRHLRIWLDGVDMDEPYRVQLARVRFR